MDSSVDFFPKNLNQALALIYVEHQDLKGKTPSEILEIYCSAYEEIKNKRQTSRR